MCLVIMLVFLAIVGFISAIVGWLCTTFGATVACIVAFVLLAACGALLEGRNK